MRVFTYRSIISLIIAIKLACSIFFSSHYLSELFLPFISHFLSHGGNPWEFFYQHASSIEFPYNPLMLYILSIFYAPVHLLGIESMYIKNLFLKLPSLCADVSILWMLQGLFSGRKREIVLGYFMSPIIIYAVYMHSQLDLIPTALLVAAVYCLRKMRVGLSALWLGLAISCKFHVIAAYPLLIVYVLRNYSLLSTSYFVAIPLVLYAFFTAPFAVSQGFYHLVLAHHKQMMIFDSFANLGEYKIYVPVYFLALVYGRFFVYEKINFDLLYAFLGIVFSSFLLFIIPAPAWYVWMLPFLILIFIKSPHAINGYLMMVYAACNLLYLAFFLFFYTAEYQDLLFCFTPINMKMPYEKLGNMVLTSLDATLLLIVYCLYRFGVKSNAIYKRTQALVLGISGDSGAGKSVLMQDIKQLLGNRLTEIEGDGDHKWVRGDAQWNAITHLNPKANYLHRQAENILTLKHGAVVWRPNYDHKTGTFTKPVEVTPYEFIVISGLHSFYLPKMRKLIDLKIFLDPAPNLRTHWKVVRDMQDRGHSHERVLAQMNARMQDRHKYIEPQREFSDLVIHYYTDAPLDLGNPDIEYPLKLKVTLDSSVRLEHLVQILQEEKVLVHWDYANDLKTQYIILGHPFERSIIQKAAKMLLSNFEDLNVQAEDMLDGYRGFVQLIILIMVSEKMKEQDSVEIT